MKGSNESFVSEKVLVQLNLTLVTKSDAYSDSSLRSIFRLNNSHYLQKALQSGGLLPLLMVKRFLSNLNPVKLN